MMMVTLWERLIHSPGLCRIDPDGLRYTAVSSHEIGAYLGRRVTSLLIFPPIHFPFDAQIPGQMV